MPITGDSTEYKILKDACDRVKGDNLLTCEIGVREGLGSKIILESFKNKTVAVSGSGNVAQYATEKVIELGGKVVTLSDSSGSIYDPKGINTEKLQWVMDLKNNKRGRIKEYTKKFGGEYWEGKRPWEAKCDVALPCATQNEISKADAEILIKNGCICVALSLIHI